MAKNQKPIHKVEMTDVKRSIIRHPRNDVLTTGETVTNYV